MFPTADGNHLTNVVRAGTLKGRKVWLREKEGGECQVRKGYGQGYVEP